MTCLSFFQDTKLNCLASEIEGGMSAERTLLELGSLAGEQSC